MRTGSAGRVWVTRAGTAAVVGAGGAGGPSPDEPAAVPHAAVSRAAAAATVVRARLIRFTSVLPPAGMPQPARHPGTRGRGQWVMVTLSPPSRRLDTLNGVLSLTSVHSQYVESLMLWLPS